MSIKLAYLLFFIFTKDNAIWNTFVKLTHFTLKKGTIA